MTIILQGESIGSESDFHRALSQQLDLGSHYGHNLAALWDRLTTDVERPLHLVWKDSSTSRKLMGEATFHAIVRLLQDVERQDIELERTEVFTFTHE